MFGWPFWVVMLGIFVVSPIIGSLVYYVAFGRENKKARDR